MSYSVVINLIREQLPKLEPNDNQPPELVWDFDDMQKFIMEFAKIKAVENKLTNENRQRIMEIELCLVELQSTRPDLFVRKFENEESSGAQRKVKKKRSKFTNAELHIKLEKEDLRGSYVLKSKTKRKAESSSVSDSHEDDGDDKEEKNGSLDNDLNKSESPSPKRMKLDDQVTDELPGRGYFTPAVMNSHDPVWINIYKNLKEMNGEEINALAPCQNALRDAVIAWMDWMKTPRKN